MPARKHRIPAVLDTNVLIGYYLSRSPRSANAQVVRAWRDQRQVQLILSSEVFEEYLDVLRRLCVEEPRVQRLAERIRRRTTVTVVNLGPRFTMSRAPDDNLMLATSQAGEARYLVTNDHDLLDIPIVQRRLSRFEIVSPQQFLAKLTEKRRQ